ncbi:MAG: carbohydrate-binding protein, partial [Ruminococcus sp.]
SYQGIMLKNPASYQLDGGGNNHHSLVEFKGKTYVLYHSRNVERKMGVNNGSGFNYRSPHIDEATVSSDGKVTATGSMKGVTQIETLNPYTKVQAETMQNQSKGISVNGLSDTTVTGKKGDWTRVTGVNFNKGASSITVRASAKNDSVIKICTGGAKGTAIGYVEIPGGGSMSEVTFPLDNVSGTQDLTFVFSDEIVFDWWSIA